MHKRSVSTAPWGDAVAICTRRSARDFAWQRYLRPALLLLLLAWPTAAFAQTDAGQSTLAAADGNAVADDIDTELITATLLEADGSTPVVGHTVILVVASGGSTGVTISSASGPSDTSGVVTFTVRSSVAKTVQFQAIDLTDSISITQLAGVTFDPNVTDAGVSTCVAATGTAVADNLDTDTITVTLLNAAGNALVGHTVTLTAVGSPPGVTIAAPGGTTSDASGQVVFTVKSSNVQSVDFEATDTTDTVTITQQATVNFTAHITDAAVSTVVADEGAALVDGVDSDRITVTLLNAAGNPVAGKTVSLVVSGSDPGVTITPVSGTTSDASGQVEFDVESTGVGTVNFEATDTTDGVTVTQLATVNFTANVSNAGNSTCTAATGTAVGDDVDTDTITVTLLNAESNPVPGHTVSLAGVGGPAGVTIAAPGGTTSDAAGQVTFTVRSDRAQSVNFAATDTTNTVTITQQATVNFTANISTAGDSTVVAATGTAVGDNVDTDTITVTLINSLGHAVYGHTVSLAGVGSPAGVTIAAPGGTTSDAAGQVTFTVRSDRVQSVDFEATDTTNAVTVTQQATVNFAASVTDAGGSTCAAADGGAVADDTDTELITVTLLNALGHAVFGHDVSLVVSSGGLGGVTIGPASGQSDASGVVTFEVRCALAKTVGFEATDDTDGITVTQTATVVFDTDLTNAGLSTVVATSGGAVGDDIDTDTITVTLLNAAGNPRVGNTVSLSAVGAPAGVTISAPGGTISDAAGQVTFTVRSDRDQSVDFEATDTDDGVTITQQATVVFAPHVTNAGNSTVVAVTGTAIADDVDTDAITVTLLNAAGNPLVGHTVSLAAVGGPAGVTISAPGGTTSDASGQVTFAVKSSNVQSVDFAATDDTDSVTVTQQATVNFTANITNAGNATCVAATGTAVADNVDTDAITVTLLNVEGNPVPGHSVSLATVGSPPGVTISAPGGTTSDAAGQVVFAARSTTVQSVGFEATDTTNAVTITQQATVNFTANVTNAGLSTVVAATGTAIADDVDTDTITVTLLNAGGNPVAGKTVSLAAVGTPAGVTISAPGGTTSDASGQVTFTVRSDRVQSVDFEATDTTNAVTITQQATVNFTANISAAGNSTVVATAGNAVADDVDTDTITVTLINSLGHAVYGHTVSLAAVGSPAGVTISAPGGTTSDAAGQVTFTVRSDRVQNVNFEATDDTDTVTVTQQATVNFTANISAAGNSTVVASAGNAVADDVDTDTITVTLINSLGHAVYGHTVSLAAVGSPAGVTINAPGGTTSDAAGQVTFTVRSDRVQSVDFEATDDTDTVTVTQQATVNFTANVSDAGNSTVVAATGTAVADDVDTDTITVTLINSLGHVVYGHTVSLAAVGAPAGVTISAPGGTTSDASGQVVFAVSSDRVQSVDFEATDDTDTVTITQQVTVNFTASISGAGDSTCVASAGNAVADNVDTDTITVTLINSLGHAVYGHTVSLAAVGAPAGVTINAPGGTTTDAAGQVVFAVSSDRVQSVDFEATDGTDTVTVTQQATVNFTDNDTDAGNSTVAASAGNAVADNIDTDTITVTLINSLGNRVYDHTVSLAAVGAPAGVTVTPVGGVISDANGQVTFNVSSDREQVVQFEATDETDTTTVTQQATVNFGANVTDSGNSTCGEDDGLAVADGFDTETITVTLLNSLGNPVYGHDVTLTVASASVDGSVVGVSGGSTPTDVNGQVTYNVSSTVAQDVELRAADLTDFVVITQIANVTFASNTTDPGEASVATDDGTCVADGVNTEQITVTLHNAFGNPVVGHDVALAVTVGNTGTVGGIGATATSDALGRAQFDVSSTEVQTVTLQATDTTENPDVVITQTVNVDFTANITNPGTSEVTAADGSADADGVDTELITVTLRNADGHAVPGHDVALAVAAGGADNVTISAPSGPSDAAGEVTFTVSSTESKLITLRATDTTDGVAVALTANVEFVPGSADHLVFALQPANSDVGSTLAIAVEVVDALENRVDVDGEDITLTLVDPDSCGGSLLGTTTLATTAGLAQFGPTEDVTTDVLCSGYRIEASSVCCGSVQSDLFAVGFGTNIACAGVTLDADDTEALLAVTYSITGSQTVAPFTVRYGLRAAGSSADIDETFGTVELTSSTYLAPGVHTLSLGDVREDLDSIVRHNDLLAVVLDYDDDVDESDETDNVGTATLSVDLRVDSVTPVIQAAASAVRVLYSVLSPAAVPSFAIRVGVDEDEDGTFEFSLPTVTATGTETTPGPHEIEVEITDAFLRRVMSTDDITLAAWLDTGTDVVEKSEGNNYLASSAAGYSSLTVTLVNAPEQLTVSEDLVVTWRVSNTGVAAADDVTLTVPIPDSTSFIRADQIIDDATDELERLGADVGDESAIIVVGTIAAGESVDVVIRLQPETDNQIELWAEVGSADQAADRSNTVTIGSADEFDPASAPSIEDVITEEITTTIRYTSLCGGVSVPLLVVGLLGLAGLRHIPRTPPNTKRESANR